MCGISGAFGPGAERAIVDRMTNALAHRGPDDSGLEAGPGWALGHRRLSILDLSPAGHQPMSSADGRYWIVYNGELFNYGALRGSLEKSHGWYFAGRSDTEVLLALCQLYGQEALERLEGMYAFMVHDRRTGHAWGARDPYGIKPLYYHERAGTLFFASELTALEAGIGRQELSEEARLAYLGAGYVPGPLTVVDQIRELEPGHVLQWDGLAARTLRGPGALAGSGSPAAASERDGRDAASAPTAREVRAALEDAVTSHLLSDVRVGAFLSGGLDSGIVVGLMAQHSAGPVPTFSIRFDVGGDRYDEGDAARRWAQHWNTEHHERTLTGDEIAASLPDFFAHLDQPSHDGINTYWVAREASAHVKVALTGLGGDELFGGYHTHRFAAATQGLWPGWFALARLTRGGQRLVPGPWRQHRLMRAWQAAGEATWAGRYARLRRVAQEDEARALMAQARGTRATGLALAGPSASSGYQDPFAARLEAVASQTPGEPLDQVAEVELALYMANQLLRDSDALSMAHGLELRVPFLAEGLRRRLASGPRADWLAPTVGKVLLREAFADWPWPSGARKKGFEFPLALWARTNPAFRDWLLDVLSARRLGATGRWDEKAVERQLRTFLEGSLAQARTAFGPLWAIASYEAWCIHHGH